MIDDENEPKVTNEVIPDTEEGDGTTSAETKPAPKKAASKRTTKPKDDRVEIILEENDDIPPTGLFLGLNGRGYLLSPGEKAKVPVGIVEVLENAITSTPVLDPQTKQVIGYRDRMKYPFRKV
jgi:hypothetical protein